VVGFNRMANKSQENISPFNRNFFDSDKAITYIGTGLLGGKAQGLVSINENLTSRLNTDDFSQIKISVPTMTVIRTDIFDTFMGQNDLYPIALSDVSNDRIAHAFQSAEIPFEILGDLRGLISHMHSPLAVRSSGILEDALYEPFAGVYGTKMIPNNQLDTDTRFNKLIEAIKFVYASTYFKASKDYINATGYNIEKEKMAVIIQEVVGRRHHDRYYPEVSGVARSYNFYPMGRALPEDGVVNLALGLGKTIVDGGISWDYSPAYPKIDPPYGSVEEFLNQTQNEFWVVNMGEPAAYDPIKDTEYMVKENLTAAEMDGTLRQVASTLDNNSGKLSIGIGTDGPRVLTFAPLLILNDIPLNKLIKSLMSLCEVVFHAPVEIEFAMTFDKHENSDKPHHFGFLQVRPMVVSTEKVNLDKEELTGDNILVASEHVLGNGRLSTIKDIVYVNPEKFEAKHTRKIASEVASINKKLLRSNRPFLLIGFGRWGSSETWLGIPVNWGQISGAKVIIEASRENMNVQLSQGSHFFHNLTSFHVYYFSISASGSYSIDWDWLSRQPVEEETRFIRHVKLLSPLQIKVNGRNGCGVIYKS
jgi:hypothetical protein